MTQTSQLLVVNDGVRNLGGDLHLVSTGPAESTHPIDNDGTSPRDEGHEGERQLDQPGRQGRLMSLKATRESGVGLSTVGGGVASINSPKTGVTVDIFVGILYGVLRVSV